MLISPAYIEQNKRLHSSKESYGSSSEKWVNDIAACAIGFDAQSILDYGCGKGAVKRLIGDMVTEYDPAIEGKDTIPEPHDMLACTDVLEHIEPDCLMNVLADIRRCTVKVAFLTIDLRPARKFLDDGRNAHLIVESYMWWLGKLVDAGFEICDFRNMRGKIKVIVR